MAISTPQTPDQENPLDENFLAPPPIVEPETQTSTGGGQGGAKPAASSQAAAPAPTQTAQGAGASGRAASPQQGPQAPQQPTYATRTGVGPGGPAMGFEDAYRMLNAPSSLAQVAGSVGAAQGQGNEMAESFRQAAGGDISFGAAEQGQLGAALETGATGQTMQQARDVLNRQYQGPSAMGQKEGEQGSGEVDRTQNLLEQSDISARAMGRGAGQAAIFGQQGLGTGQATRETERRYAEGGGDYARRAQQIAASATEAGAGLAQQFAASQQVGELRDLQARQAGGEARESFTQRAEGIKGAAGEAARETQREMVANQDQYDSAVETGDWGALGAAGAVMRGESSIAQAQDRWGEIQGKYPDISDYTMQLGNHYTGRRILEFTEGTKNELRNDPRFSQLRSIFGQMRGGSGRFPGRWMDLLHTSAVAGGNAAWDTLTPQQQMAMFDRANPRRSSQNNTNVTTRRNPQLTFQLYQQQYERSRTTGLQARDMLGNIVTPMMQRQRELEADFAPDIGVAQGAGIRSPDQIAAGGVNTGAPGEARTSGGYLGRTAIRPGSGAGEGRRGQYANIMPLYLGGSNVMGAPNLGNQASGYMERPEGQATWQSEVTPEMSRRYNRIQGLMGNATDQLNAGQPLDPSMRMNIDRLLEDEGTFATETGSELTENERDYSRRVDEMRERYIAAERRASSSWFHHSGSYKRPPTYEQGGVRDNANVDWQQA